MERQDVSRRFDMTNDYLSSGEYYLFVELIKSLDVRAHYSTATSATHINSHAPVPLSSRVSDERHTRPSGFLTLMR